MKADFTELAHNMAQAGLIPGIDFSYDAAGRQLLLSEKAWAWVEKVAPGARDRARKRFS
jgi:hypothetical protein